MGTLNTTNILISSNWYTSLMQLLSKSKQNVLYIKTRIFYNEMIMQRTRITETTLKKKNRVEGISLPAFKSYYIATVIKTVVLVMR